LIVLKSYQATLFIKPRFLENKHFISEKSKKQIIYSYTKYLNFVERDFLLI
jgi:hypothetical protein